MMHAAVSDDDLNASPLYIPTNKLKC